MKSMSLKVLSADMFVIVYFHLDIPHRDAYRRVEKHKLNLDINP